MLHWGLPTPSDTAATERSEQHAEELRAEHPGRIILRVDRTDPSKNILRGFLAYRRMFELHPELIGQVTFLALLQPRRQDVDEYVRYRDAIEATVATVNAALATPTWRPIDLRFEENLALAVAAYSMFDVLLVNAVADGMNLVAKEALLVNERDGVLVLSENTGAHAELGAIALTIQPFDIEDQADALHEALTMDAASRHARHDAGVEIVRTNSPAKWLSRQLADIDELAFP